MKKSNISKRRRKEHLIAYAFILPDFLGLFIFVIIPIIYAFYISFFKWDFINEKIFVGAANYIRMWKDMNWWNAMLRTLKLTVLYVPLLFCLSLFFAALISTIF